MEGFLKQFLVSTYFFWYALISAGLWWLLIRKRVFLKLNWGAQWFLIFILLPFLLLEYLENL
jgi:hypothetical protein